MSRRRRQPRPSPDENLAPYNYAELNRTFYASKPADYLGRRLSNLILTAGRYEDLDRLTDEGVTFRSLKVGAATGIPAEPGQEEPTREERQKAADHYVTAEAEVLAHHAGETLLRLVIAHEFEPGNAPPCPWLAVSRERSFAAFKQKVADRFGPDIAPGHHDRLKSLARVFHLVDDPARLAGATSVPTELWDRSLRNIEGYLRGFADMFLRRASLYNAAKHGLALRADEMTMRWDDGSVVRAKGPMIFEVQQRGGLPRWTLVHHWVKPDRQMAMTYRAIQLIETLWEVARLRYLPDKRPERFQVRFFGGASWDEIMGSDAERTGGIVVESMAMDLLYYKPAHDIAADTLAEVPPEAEVAEDIITSDEAARETEGAAEPDEE